jgi:hypothetical protein
MRSSGRAGRRSVCARSKSSLGSVVANRPPRLRSVRARRSARRPRDASGRRAPGGVAARIRRTVASGPRPGRSLHSQRTPSPEAGQAFGGRGGGRPSCPTPPVHLSARPAGRERKPGRRSAEASHKSPQAAGRDGVQPLYYCGELAGAAGAPRYQSHHHALDANRVSRSQAVVREGRTISGARRR